MHKQKVSMVIVAAGNGTRFGRDKLFIEVGKKTVIERILEKFIYLRSLGEIDELVLVVNPKNREQFMSFLEISEWSKEVRVISGGRERWESSLLGIKATTGDLVLIHDAARPFIKLETVKEAIAKLRAGEPAILVAIPSVNSVKYVSDDGFNTHSLPRHNIWLAQTPQGFQKELVLAAYNKALEEKFEKMTDESELVTQFMEQNVKIIQGDESNLKITFVNDLPLAEEVARLEDLGV